MQNPPTIISLPPPFPFPPPPQSAGQVVVLPAPPPPFRPFATAPSSSSQITVLPAPPQPPPPFFGESSSVDLSPIEFLLALVAIITIPALIYTFIFAYGCSSSSSNRRRSDELSDAQSVATELSRHDVESVPVEELAGVKHLEIRPEKISGECPVCLSVFADGEEVRELSVCKHSFHSACIDLWLSNHSNCPICRTIVTDAAAVKSSGNGRDGDVQPGPGDASSLV
ncbi:RING-H2 finger protein ATL33-like [Vicia villosa]|uniref:RING-H2 finger protein ATL33-like n=1 Tax=Vicia villosa TaxID=3911 RepID=UPI00273C1EC8|nr:RING-H2 finger protein ATL33-like [Vicia villosa]